MVATRVMEVLTSTPSAHSGMTQKNVVVGCRTPDVRQADSAVYKLRGEFREQQSQLFIGNNYRVRVRRSLLQRSGLDVRAIDAAQPFDYESVRLQELQNKNKLKVGIVGFGNFGQFLAARIVKQGHRVLAYSRTDYSEKAQELGVAYFRSVVWLLISRLFYSRLCGVLFVTFIQLNVPQYGCKLKNFRKPFIHSVRLLGL